MFSWFVYLFFFISTKSKKSKGHPLLSLGHQEALFWSCPPTRESLKKPYFPLPLSILVGTNLIMLLLFFLQPPFDSQENPSPIRFLGKFIIVWFPRKSMQNPQRKQKNCFSFAPCVFWICFRGLFAVMPLDLNFTNPKSTIFEPG